MGKRWTAEELDYLKEMWGVKSITAIMQHLGRSKNAIMVMQQRLKLGPYLENGEYVTFNQFWHAIGKESSSYSYTLDRWVRNGFPLKRKKLDTKVCKVVYIEDFWKWAEQHKEMIDFYEMPPLALGKEPDWVKTARQASYANQKKTTPWTIAEDQQLVDMLKTYRYHLDEIANILGRSEGAVKRRIHDISTPYRPLKREIRPWSEDEVKQMLQLRAKGYDWDAIGGKLKRSGQSCRGKYEMLLNPMTNKSNARHNKAALADCFQKHQCVHWRKALGCELGGTDCDTCVTYLRCKDGEKPPTGWNTAKFCSTAEELLNELNKEEDQDMSKNTRGTEEERAIHKEACRLRKMTDAQLVGAFKAAQAQASGNDGVKKLIDGFARNECPGVRAATTAKIIKYATDKGLL